MKITIQAIHFRASQRLQNHIQQKISKLDQFFDRIIEGEVTLKVHNEMKGANKYVEVQVNVPGQVLVASNHAHSFEAAVDTVTEKLRKQLRTYKGKMSQVRV